MMVIGGGLLNLQDEKVETFGNKMFSNKALTMRTPKLLNLNKEIASLWKNIWMWIKSLWKSVHKFQTIKPYQLIMLILRVVLNQGQSWPLRDIWQTSCDIFDCYWHLVDGRQGLLNILQCTGQCSATKNYLVHIVNSSVADKPCLRGSWT